MDTVSKVCPMPLARSAIRMLLVIPTMLALAFVAGACGPQADALAFEPQAPQTQRQEHPLLGPGATRPARATQMALPPPGKCAIDDIAIRTDPPDGAAPQVYLRAPNGAERQWDLRVLPAGTEIFHWDTEAQVEDWSAQGRVSPQVVDAWLRDSDYGHYRGLWVSLHPFDAINYGSHLLVVTLLEPLLVLQVPGDFEQDPFDDFAQAAAFGVGYAQDCSWAAHLQKVGIGAIGKAPLAPRAPDAPWPDWLAVFASEAFASTHGAQQHELMVRLRTTAWEAERLGLPAPILKLIALTRVAVHPAFSLAQLPLTFFDDAPWLHQALTHGTVQDELPTFRIKNTRIDIKSYICRWLPDLPGWQPSALYHRLAHALCQDAEAAAEACREET